MTVTVKCTLKLITYFAASNRCPQITVQVNVCCQLEICVLVVCARIDLLCQIRQLRGIGNLIRNTFAARIRCTCIRKILCNRSIPFTDSSRSQQPAVTLRNAPPFLIFAVFAAAGRGAAAAAMHRLSTNASRRLPPRRCRICVCLPLLHRYCLYSLIIFPPIFLSDISAL